MTPLLIQSLNANISNLQWRHMKLEEVGLIESEGGGRGCKLIGRMERTGTNSQVFVKFSTR